MEQKTANAPNRLRTFIEKTTYIGIYPFVRYTNITTGIKLNIINKFPQATNLLFDKEPNTNPIELKINVNIP